MGTFVGCLIGFAVGIVQTIPVSKQDSIIKRALLFIVKLILNIYVEVFRGTPMIVQAMFIYFGAMQYLGITMGMWFAAFFIVSTEGAKAIGMTHFQTMLYVIFPQTLRNIIPQIGNNLIINIKDSSVLSVIGVIELYYAAKQTAGAYYWWFEAMTVAMVLYLIMTFVFSRLLRFWESKLDGPASFDLATTDQLAHTSGNYSYPGEGSFDKERNIETDVNGGRDK